MMGILWTHTKPEDLKFESTKAKKQISRKLFDSIEVISCILIVLLDCIVQIQTTVDALDSMKLIPFLSLNYSNNLQGGL